MNQPDHHHPSQTLLFDFVRGELTTGISIVVSAHVDGCSTCKTTVSQLQERSSNEWYDASQQHWDADFDSILEQIVSQPVLPYAEPATIPPDDTRTQLYDRLVPLPRLLAQIARRGLQWKELVNGIHQALVPLDSSTKFEFVCMQPGARVPRHSHMGHEYMLVLEGSLCDELGNYHAQDFVERDRHHSHAQVSEEGCVCLFVTDAPLKFSEGRARLLNPFNHLKHWWKTWRRQE